MTEPMDGVAAAIDAFLLHGIILEIVIVIIDYLILLVATLPQLFLSNPTYNKPACFGLHTQLADFLR